MMTAGWYRGASTLGLHWHRTRIGPKIRVPNSELGVGKETWFSRGEIVLKDGNTGCGMRHLLLYAALQESASSIV